ncbi:MAG: serine hydrolase [Proteobacteria bacterium]|nr:serine hydrolase [Pseudomonadota bacterium]
MAAPPAKAEDFARRLAAADTAGKLGGLHVLLVSVGGNLVFEHYGKGADEKRGQPLGTVTFGPRVLHDLRSVSKTVVGLLYGIALAEGKVPAPDAGLYAQFPDYADLAKQPGRDRITIGHALSMSMGLEWDESSAPYSDPRNSETQMDNASDRYRFILERKIVGEPGAKWTYCGGATALLGRLIARGTGGTLLAYARRALFEPLGFGPVEWMTGRDGEPIAASGLRLLPRDLLKIGQLILARGKEKDRQIVSVDWLRQSLTPKVVLPDGRRYGYHWYLGQRAVGTPPRQEPWFGGIGWGGQQLLVFPNLDLVVGINCGNYRLPGREQAQVIGAVLDDVVLPGFG